jgi:hypothetical protein
VQGGHVPVCVRVRSPVLLARREQDAVPGGMRHLRSPPAVGLR